MKKFKYPLLITGSKEETDEIVTELEKLGYYTTHSNFESQRSIVTCFGGVEDQYVKVVDIDGWELINGHSDCSRTVVSASNPELVLALAAAAEDNEFYAGEVCYWEGNGPKIVTLTKKALEHNCWESNDPDYSSLHEMYLRKLSKEELIHHFNKQPMEKKIIGYKLKEDCKQYEKAAYEIAIKDGVDWNNLKKEGILFYSQSNAHVRLQQAGVLDLWFEPVYEPEKPKVEIVTLRCEGGTFEVEVSKEGIYYRPDGKWIYGEDIRSVLASVAVFKDSDPKPVRAATTYYEFKPSHIDSGCKKQVPRKDWEKVLSVYDNFQK